MKFKLFESREVREKARVDRINMFVFGELLPETRASTLRLIRMFPHDPGMPDNDLLVKYIAESHNDFFRNLETKNYVERRIAEEKAKLEADALKQKEKTWTEFVDAEARIHISHMIHDILSGNISENTVYPPELFKWAEDVRTRAQELIQSQRFS
jgi:hypothetical protein